MAEIKVTITYIAGVVVVNPVSVTLYKDDWISFVAGDKNIYDVKIDSTSLFNTKKTVLMYQVYDCNTGDTPTTKPNPGPNPDIFYVVYATASDDVNRTDPNAPPKIIIVPHT